jgi:hypothetical protein
MAEDCNHKNPEEEQIEALSYAGAVIDKAVEFLIGKDIDASLVASALLGGAIGLLCQSMDDEGILRVLENAKSSVLSGELRVQ